MVERRGACSSRSSRSSRAGTTASWTRREWARAAARRPAERSSGLERSDAPSVAGATWTSTVENGEPSKGVRDPAIIRGTLVTQVRSARPRFRHARGGNKSCLGPRHDPPRHRCLLGPRVVTHRAHRGLRRRNHRARRRTPQRGPMAGRAFGSHERLAHGRARWRLDGEGARTHSAANTLLRRPAPAATPRNASRTLARDHCPRSPCIALPSGAPRRSTTTGRRSFGAHAAIAITTTSYASCDSWSTTPSAATMAFATSLLSVSRRPCPRSGCVRLRAAARLPRSSP